LQRKSCHDQDTHFNITPQYNLLESQFVDSQNEAVQEPSENIIQDVENSLLDAPRQLHQLYGKDFNENGETVQ